MSIRLITEKYIKDNSPVSQGVDIAVLGNHIDSAQEMFIQEILGTQLYSAILEKFGNQTLDATETELVTILKKVLVARTFELALPFLSIKTGAVGAHQTTGDTYTPASRNMIEYLVGEMRDRAEFQTERARKHLIQNREHYPTWTVYLNNSVQPTTSGEETYDSDLFFY